MKKHLQKLLYAFLNPQCLRGIGIYLGSSKPCRMHRKLALNIHPKLSRSTWYAILAASTICWYFAIFWFQLTHSLHIAFKHKQFTFRAIPKLLYIGLWLGSSPYNYFALNLTNAKKLDWVFYIFLEEQITWHRLFNTNTQQITHQHHDLSTLNDKKIFSEYLLSNSLPAIATIETVTQSNRQRIEQKIDRLIDNNTHFFVKPQSSNAMKGCLWVTARQQESECNAFGFNCDGQFIELQSKQQLIQFVVDSLGNLSKKNSLPANQRNLLLQQHFQSNQQIRSILNSDLPISLRLITYQSKGNSENVRIAYAYLEECFEIKNTKMLWRTHNIDPLSGEVNHQRIKGWATIVNDIINTHALFPSVHTIAWDTIYTEQGLKIIEGNFGWDAITPQRISHCPLLKVITHA